MTTKTLSKPRKVRSVANGVVRGPTEIITEAQSIRIPPAAWTLDGFREWTKAPEFPQRGRISFLGGEIIVDMSPEELINHNQVKVEVGRVTGNINVQEDRGLLFGDRTSVTNKAADLSTEPDGTFVTWEAIESGRVRLVPRKGDEGEYMEVEGSPDWLLEIVSKYSVRKDTQLLQKKYHRAKVGEYWLIDARGRKIRFSILLYTPTGFKPAPVRNGWQHSRVFGRSFRLERKRDRMRLWQYRLHVKPE